jgi:hypothetical protein
MCVTVRWNEAQKCVVTTRSVCKQQSHVTAQQRTPCVVRPEQRGTTTNGNLQRRRINNNTTVCKTKRQQQQRNQQTTNNNV